MSKSQEEFRYLSCKKYKTLLEQTYKYHLQRNSSNFITSITTSINHSVIIMNHAFNFSISTIIIIALVFVLALTSPIVSIFTFTLFGGSYFIIGKLVKKRLAFNSKIIEKNRYSNEVFK